jgi:hypothetical protein
MERNQSVIKKSLSCRKNNRVGSRLGSDFIGSNAVRVYSRRSYIRRNGALANLKDRVSHAVLKSGERTMGIGFVGVPVFNHEDKFRITSRFLTNHNLDGITLPPLYMEP